MPVQYFVLDSTAAGYAAALTALASHDAAKYSFTPTQTVRTFSGDGDYRIVKANVTEAELDGDANLADLRRANFLAGNALCRHRFADLDEFRLMGFHMLGESVRGHEAAAGRSVRFSRPQNGRTAAPHVQGAGYGKKNGLTYADAYNGEQDHLIKDGGTTVSAEHQTGRTYYVCGKQFARVNNQNGSQIDYSNGLGNAGRTKLADATGLGAAGAIEIRGDYSFDPGLMLGGGKIYDTFSYDPDNPLPWELYDAANNIYVQGRFQGAAAAWSAGKTEFQWDLDADDITVNLDTFLQRYAMKGQSTLSALNGTTGRARYYVEDGDFATGHTACDKVIVFDGTNYTDVTAAAADATANDFEAFAVGATVGAYIAFISTTVPPSVLRHTVSQAVAGTGLTLTWKYGRTSDYNTFTNIKDQTAGWTTVASLRAVEFNPKSDWVQTTEAAGEPFETTGYVVRLEITAGTVTTAGRGSQSDRAAAQCFVHRWDDSAPTHGPSFSQTCALRHDYDESGKRNYKIHNLRMIGNAAWNQMNDCPDLQMFGVQCAVQSPLFLGAGSNIKVKASINGTPDWYAKTDRRVQDDTHAVFTHAQYGLIAAHGDDPALYTDIPNWSDFAYTREGPYANNAALGGGEWDGVTLRHIGGPAVTNMSGDVLFDHENETGDHHWLANLGGQDFTAVVFQRIGAEDIVSSVFYTQGTGDADQPVLGSGSSVTGLTIEHGWIHTWNGTVDSGQPNYAFHFSGDNDKGAYSDGTGKWGTVNLNFLVIVAMNESLGGNYKSGRGLVHDHDTPLVGRNLSFVECNWAWTMHNNDPQSIHVFRYDDSLGTYTDITANVRLGTPTGAADLFPAGAGVGDRVIFAYPTTLDYRPRRAAVTISTAAVGGPTLVTEYYRNDASWAAASNVVDGTSGFTVSGTITTDHAADYGSLNINGTNYQCFSVRISAGSFSTIPQATAVEGINLGANIDIQDYVVWKPKRGVGYSQLISGGTGVDANSARIRDVNCRLYYDPATQTAGDNFWGWNINTSVDATPNLASAGWQAKTKLAANTDAREDSVFGSGLSIAAAA